MKVLTQRLFWSAYFKIYDALCEIRPYQQSIQRGVSLLKIRPGGRYLDLACGTGNSTRALKRSEVEVVGLDSSRDGLNIARDRFPGLRFIFGDFNRSLPFADCTFNGVFAHNALYLAKDPLRTLAEVHRILKPGGILVMSNPKAGASPLIILEEHLKTRYQDFCSSSQSAARIVPEAAEKFGVFLAFLPFQIALKYKGGGAANFWDREQWQNLIDQLSRSGKKFSLLAVEPAYAGQNLTFALQKE